MDLYLESFAVIVADLCETAAIGRQGNVPGSQRIDPILGDQADIARIGIEEIDILSAAAIRLEEDLLRLT